MPNLDKLVEILESGNVFEFKKVTSDYDELKLKTLIDKEGRNLLHIASLNGELEILKLLIQKYNFNINDSTSTGDDAIYLAAINGHSHVVQWLEEQVFSISNDFENDTCAEDATVDQWLGCNEIDEKFWKAVKDGNIKYLKSVCTHDYILSATDLHRSSIGHVAAEEGHLAILEYIDSHGFNWDLKNNVGETPFQMAAYNGHLDVMKFLVRKTNDIYSHNNQKWNAMHISCYEGHLSIVQWLEGYERFSIKSSKNCNQGEPYSFISIYGKKMEVLKWLIRKGENIDSINEANESLLHASISDHNTTITKWLVDNGCSMKHKTSSNLTVFHYCLLHNNMAALKILVEYDRLYKVCIFEDCIESEYIPFAIVNSSLEMVKFMAIDLKCDLTRCKVNGLSLVEYAKSIKNHSLVNEILRLQAFQEKKAYVLAEAAYRELIQEEENARVEKLRKRRRRSRQNNPIILNITKDEASEILCENNSENRAREACTIDMNENFQKKITFHSQNECNDPRCIHIGRLMIRKDEKSALQLNGYHDDWGLVTILPLAKKKYLESDIYRECRNLAQVGRVLYNSSILRYYSNAEDDDQFYFMFEPCTKLILHQYWNNENPLVASGVSDRLLNLVYGLRDVHEFDILHTNLRPSNLWLTPDNAIRIGGFEYCNTTLEKSSYPIVLDEWCAPECLEQYPCTKSSDVFSLGLCLYYILSNGHHPFHNCILQMKKRAYNWGPVMYSEEGLDILQQMLEIDPLKRPSMNLVVNHPFFWTMKQKLQYIEHLANCMTHYQEKLIKIKAKWIKSWQKRVGIILMKHWSQYRTYNSSLIDLLRLIRNLLQHRHEQSDFVWNLIKDHLIESNENWKFFLEHYIMEDNEMDLPMIYIGSFFSSCFPNLCLKLWKTIGR